MLRALDMPQIHKIGSSCGQDVVLVVREAGLEPASRTATDFRTTSSFNAKYPFSETLFNITSFRLDVSQCIYYVNQTRSANSLPIWNTCSWSGLCLCHGMDVTLRR